MRKNERLMEIIGKIDGKWVEEAAEERRIWKRGWKWGAAAAGIAAAAAAAVLLWPGNTATPGGSLGPVKALAEASYPAEGTAAGTEEGLPDQIGRFADQIAGKVLKEEGNQICSPSSAYLALAMLAECTQGESRAQILELLGTERVEELRALARGMWETVYLDGKTDTVIPANSIWLNLEMPYREELTALLSENYYADSYQGKMGTEEMNEKLQEWLNNRTGKLLKDQVQEIRTEENDAMALVSALYLNARWREPFDAEATVPGEFTEAGGNIVETDFMNRAFGAKMCSLGERYQAVWLDFEEAGRMILMLPEEGYSPEDLLDDADAMAALRGEEGQWDEQRKVLLSLPKFDVTGEAALEETLKELDVKDVFDAEKADFSGLTEEEGLYVSKVRQAARVKIDEDGCEAAAYTAVLSAGSAEPAEEILEMRLDRPFLFSILSEEDVPLFIGKVQQPSENE